jgi:hypothetical protein
MSPDNPTAYSGPPRPLNWDGVSSGQWRIMAKEARGLRMRDWIALASMLSAALGLGGGLALQFFRTRTEGEVADAKFAAHVETQRTDSVKLDARLEKMDSKLDRLLSRQK